MRGWGASPALGSPSLASALHCSLPPVSDSVGSLGIDTTRHSGLLFPGTGRAEGAKASAGGSACPEDGAQTWVEETLDWTREKPPGIRWGGGLP